MPILRIKSTAQKVGNNLMTLNFFQKYLVVDILDTIMSIQPKEGGGSGGETRETVVFNLADDMLRKLPPQYNAFEVKENLARMGPYMPMNIFLRQEIDRMQRVIKMVHTNLVDLKLAIEGTIVMSEYLRESLDAMYDARIPSKWQKISWESTTLGFWYTELLERNQQFRVWINSDRPKVSVLRVLCLHGRRCFC